MAVTILASGTWASSLILQAILSDDGSDGLAIGLALVVIAESQTLAAASAWSMARFAEAIGRAGPDELATIDRMRVRGREANVAGDPLAAIATALRNIEQEFGPDA